jgi:2-polyprenyl-3-methyl-5-hydroxy-6-metoxy-1,4-benzoquinol methylase
MNVLAFVLASLPAPPVHVLEVGCGDGEMALRLAAAGHDVLGIDPDAPDGPLFLRTTIEELDGSGAFDAVVASRSLHHVHDLPAALDKIEALLTTGGSVIIDEFAWERLDARSAAAVGLDLAEWREEHADLHTSTAMIRELDERLIRRELTWEPYLHREAHMVVSEELERRLIAGGTVLPIGFRYVGTR